MKGDGCKRVMRRLLEDVAVVDVTLRGKPLGYLSKRDGFRHGISDGLSRALREIMEELGDAAPPARLWK